MRKISLKAAPFQVLLQNSLGKSLGFNFVDTPGHPNFHDEVQASLRLADNVIVVVDVLEGCTSYTEKLLQACIKAKKKLVLCVNKIDRLILELKLPPEDAYLKIKHCIDTINIHVQKMEAIYSDSGLKEVQKTVYFSPLIGNVVFASTKFSLCLTLRSFATLYSER